MPRSTQQNTQDWRSEGRGPGSGAGWVNSTLTRPNLQRGPEFWPLCTMQGMGRLARWGGLES